MRIAMRVIVLMVSMFATTLTQAAHRELLNVEYSDTNKASRLVFLFDTLGSVSHQMLSPVEIRLIFPETQSAAYLNHLPLIFENGHAKYVSFDLSRKDTLCVLMTLNEDTKCDLSIDTNLCSVVWEMSAVPESASTAAVDIKAIVAEQATKARESVSVSEVSVFGSLSPHALMASCVVSFLSTVVMLIFRLRKARKVKAATPKLTSRTTQQTEVDAVLAQAKLIFHEKERLNQLDVSPGEAEEPADVTLAIARKLKRGQGELQLAKNLERKSKDFSWEETIGQLDSRSKELGTVSSVGELNLALALRRVQQQQMRKERLT